MEGKEENFVTFGVKLKARNPRFPWLCNLLHGQGFTITEADAKQENNLSLVLAGYRLYFKVEEEDYICPFCHEKMDHFHCDCEEFERYFSLLQGQIKAEKNDTSTSLLSIRTSPLIVFEKPRNSGEIKVSRFEKEKEFPYRRRLECKNGRVYLRRLTYNGESLTIYLSRSHRDGNTEYYKGSTRFSYVPTLIEIGRPYDTGYLPQQGNEPQNSWFGLKTYESWPILCQELLALKKKEKE